MASISLLVSRELQIVATVARELPRAVATQLRRWTRADAQPIFQDEMSSRPVTATQQAVLVKTARVAVTDTNVMMKTAQIGKMSDGTPTSVIASGAEFGMFENTKITQRSSKGKRYERRAGRIFRRPTPRGFVFFRSADEATPRLASLWIQTAYRTVAEAFERGAS